MLKVRVFGMISLLTDVPRNFRPWFLVILGSDEVNIDTLRKIIISTINCSPQVRPVFSISYKWNVDRAVSQH